MSDQDKPPAQRDDRDARSSGVAFFFGNLLMLAGILMMFTAGACTLFGVAISGAQALTDLLLYAIPAFIVGLGIYKLGGRLWQGKKDKKATGKRP